jgi:hypothetical protein
MSSSYARRARRLARKYPEEPDYLREPETPDEWRAEIETYLDFDEHELKRDLPIIRERIAQLIETCPHEEVKAWARERWREARIVPPQVQSTQRRP